MIMSVLLRDQKYLQLRIQLGEDAARAFREEWDRVAAEQARELARSHAGELNSTDASKTSDTTKWPWGSHESENLRLLSLAGKKFWALHVPGQADTAPTNRVVIEWLMIEHNVSKSRAEAIALVLRPSDLPPGPKPGLST